MFSKNEVLFSIIVPFYNSEKTLKRCIDSVISQTYTNWELILVDDCSNDKGSVICEFYRERYPNKIKLLFNSINSGQLYSRQNGVNASSGNYVLFLDSDDSFEKDALSVIFNNFSNINFDLFAFNPNVISTDGASKNIPFLQRKLILSKQDVFQEYLYSKTFGYSCFFAIKREIALKAFELSAEFNYLRYTEDLIFLFNVFSVSDSCSQIPNQIYNYYVSNNTASTNNGLAKYRDRFDSLNYIYGYKLDKKKVLDAVEKDILFSILSFARETIIKKPNQSRTALKIIRRSPLFARYKKYRVISDKTSKLLLWLLRFRLYSVFTFAIRKFFKNNEKNH